MNDRPYYIASCSCGKDSLAMVLRLIEEGRPLDEIVFYDTGMEFSAIYTNWLLLKNYAKQRGIKCERLTPKCTFEYSIFEQPHKGKHDGIIRFGYGWCGGICRWGTHEKRQAMSNYAKQRPNTVQYIGIAHDEQERLKKKYKMHVAFPLDEWKMTEADCLEFCRKRGVTWNEKSPMTATGYVDLYDILDRVSCWCCRNKNLWELRNIWHYLPEYWEKLKALQTKLERPFKKDRSIFDLEREFKAGYRPKHIKRAKRRADT